MSTLPVQARRVTLIAITLSGLVGFTASKEIFELVDLDSLRSADWTLPLDSIDPKLSRTMAATMIESEVQALESMRGARFLTLALLAIASTLAFVVAYRMLRPDGAAREDARRMLANAAVACGALKTMDGAQLAVVARRLGGAWDKVMGASDLPGGYPDGLMSSMFSATSIASTVLVAGGFLALSSYFRSTSVKAWVAAADRSSEET
jgi:hypothetical protein